MKKHIGIIGVADSQTTEDNIINYLVIGSNVKAISPGELPIYNDSFARSILKGNWIAYTAEVRCRCYGDLLPVRPRLYPDGNAGGERGYGPADGLPGLGLGAIASCIVTIGIVNPLDCSGSQRPCTICLGANGSSPGGACYSVGITEC